MLLHGLPTMGVGCAEAVLAGELPEITHVFQVAVLETTTMAETFSCVKGLRKTNLFADQGS